VKKPHLNEQFLKHTQFSTTERTISTFTIDASRHFSAEWHNWC